MTDVSLPPVTLVGNYPPRQCGIASFTKDLHDSLRRLAAADGSRRPAALAVVAVDRRHQNPAAYPPEVPHRLRGFDPAAYRSLAAQLDGDASGVACLQHEFGIFGGPAGRHVLSGPFGPGCRQRATLAGRL